MSMVVRTYLDALTLSFGIINVRDFCAWKLNSDRLS